MFSIIIFCFNESGNIQRVLTVALSFLELNIPDFELIVVDDGSDDGSADIIDSFASLNSQKVKAIRHLKNLGIGMALKSGYDAATGEYVCAIPGDGQFEISQLSIVKPFENEVYYSFYRTDNRYGAYRKLLTLFNKLFNRIFLGIKLKDVNWIKVYRKSQLNLVKAELNSSLIESEICAKLNILGSMPIEFPSVYLERESGKPKGGNWNTLKKAANEMWTLFWIVREFKKSNFQTGF